MHQLRLLWQADAVRRQKNSVVLNSRLSNIPRKEVSAFDPDITPTEPRKMPKAFHICEGKRLLFKNFKKKVKTRRVEGCNVYYISMLLNDCHLFLETQLLVYVSVCFSPSPYERLSPATQSYGKSLVNCEK